MDPTALQPPGAAPTPPRQRSFAASRFAAWRRALLADPAAYARTRNHLDGAVTALSPYLTHGLIGEDELAAMWRKRHGLGLDDKLLLELAWRVFFQDVWGWHGEAILADMRPSVLPGARYQHSLPADIVQARTGVPVIDASVCRLYADGYLHNHQRMWLASYCVHLRKVAWRTAADWMYGHLLDGDLASNHLSWQWVAGTFSARPYLFNAANVARYAPTLASPGTAIDRSYEALANLAATQDDIGPEPGRHVATLTPPGLLARPPQLAAPSDIECMVRGRSVALVHPWDLARRPPAACVIGVLHLPYHQRFPWSEKRWAFVLGRMTQLCDTVWCGELAALGPSLAQASSVVARAALQPGYAEGLAQLPLGLGTRARWLVPAPAHTRSFSGYRKFLRQATPELFAQPRAPGRRHHHTTP